MSSGSFEISDVVSTCTPVSGLMLMSTVDEFDDHCLKRFLGKLVNGSRADFRASVIKSTSYLSFT